MDLFTRMAQNTVTDLSVFRTKRIQKEAPKEPKKIAEIQAEDTAVMAEGHTSPEAPISESKGAIEKEKQEGNTIQSEPVQEDAPVKEQRAEIEAPIESSEGSEKNISDEDEPEQGRIIQFKQPENPNEEAAIKLEMQLETAKSNLLPVFPIVRYLKNKCMNDDAFAAVVNDERKTLAKCFEYVTGEVKKALNSANGWLDDNEVYAYAETYFLTDEAVFEKIAAEKAEAERKRQEEVARIRKEQEEKRKEAAAQKRKETAAQKKVAKKAEKVSEITETEKKRAEDEDTEQFDTQLCMDM